MTATTAQPAKAHTTVQPDVSELTELSEGPISSDDRLREATLHWPDTVANPRRTRIR